MALVDRLDRDQRQRDDGDQQSPERDRQPAAAGGAMAAGVRVAGREELALVAREAEGALLLPFARLQQVRAAVQPVVVVVVRDPVRGRGVQAAVDPDALAVLVDPGAQPGPLAQQRLVGHFDAALAQRQEPTIGEHLDDAADVLAAVDLQFVEWDAPALDGAGAALCDECHQYVARGLLLLAAERPERVLPQAPHRALYASGALIGGLAQAAPVALLPELEQCGRQQRQRPRLALHVVDERAGERGLDAQA